MAILNYRNLNYQTGTVNDWAQTEYNHGVESTRFCLPSAFRFGTIISTNPEILFFEKIWIPVKNFNKERVPPDITPKQFYDLGYKWENIGLTLTDLADAYQTLYGFNLFDVPLLKDSQDSIRWSVETLGAKIKAIFNLNKGKYLRLLDLQDYTYNPLWNVDGVEIRQYLENQGINDVTSSSFGSARSIQDRNETSEHRTAPYDATGDDPYNPESKDIVTGTKDGGVSNLPKYEVNPSTGEITTGTSDAYANVAGQNASASVAGNITKYEHQNAKNKNEYDVQVDYNVDAKDTAFGEALKGGDKMHNEKYLRQGNIGVTKTQELIEAERTNLRFSVLKEFFDDINEQLLVGIYRF